MKPILVTAALAAVVTVSAYECPDTSAVNQACRDISVFPLVCSNPNVNVDQCNARQCNQDYINNYAACMCRRNRTTFYENSVNVEGLIRRCGGMGLVNPYGNPNQYRPGQGTQTFAPSGGTAIDAATRIISGTTYYGGQTTDVSGVTRIVSATPVVGGTTIVGGTTTWVSDQPTILSGTSSFPGATAAPIQDNPDEYVPVNSENSHVSGGAVAGIVLGILAATALAILLGICWRKKRSEHTIYTQPTVDPNARGPIRTVVTEKIEPVVVKSVPAGAATSSTSYNAVGNSSVPGTASYTTNPATTGAYYNQGVDPAAGTAQYSSSMSPSVTGAGVHSPTGAANYNATTNAYSTQPRAGVVDSVSNTAHNAAYNTSDAVRGTTTTTTGR